MLIENGDFGGGRRKATDFAFAKLLLAKGWIPNLGPLGASINSEDSNEEKLCSNRFLGHYMLLPYYSKSLGLMSRFAAEPWLLNELLGE